MVKAKHPWEKKLQARTRYLKTRLKFQNTARALLAVQIARLEKKLKEINHQIKTLEGEK